MASELAMPPIPELTTERLLLRPFTAADADRVTELLQSPEISQTTLYIAHPYRREDAAGWIGSHAEGAEAGTSLNWAICDRANGALIGAISLEVTPYHRRGMLGYWLGVPFWSRGAMGEAARAAVDYAFTELRLHRVEATCMPHNAGSARVMEKVGLSYEGTPRGTTGPEGRRFSGRGDVCAGAAALTRV